VRRRRLTKGKAAAGHRLNNRQYKFCGAVGSASKNVKATSRRQSNFDCLFDVFVEMAMLLLKILWSDGYIFTISHYTIQECIVSKL
jgi:hypothetical protein